MELKSLAVMPAAEASRLPLELLPSVVPIVEGDQIDQHRDLLVAVRMVQVADGPGVAELAGRMQTVRAGSIVSVRMLLCPSSAERVIELGRQGVKVFHLCADQHGRERLDDGRPGRHIKDVSPRGPRATGEGRAAG